MNWLVECPGCGIARGFSRRADANRAYRENYLCASCARRDIWPGESKPPYQNAPSSLENRIAALERRVELLEGCG